MRLSAKQAIIGMVSIFFQNSDLSDMYKQYLNILTYKNVNSLTHAIPLIRYAFSYFPHIN
jgi:hypothetical protein